MKDGVFFFDREMHLFLSVYVDDMKMARTIQKNMPKMWAILQKKTDLEDQVSFIDQVYLGCTQRAAQVNNSIVVEKTEIVLEADQHKC